MNRKNKQVLFISVCLLGLGIFLFLFYRETYIDSNLYLRFSDETIFQEGEIVDANKLIKDTNAQRVDAPNIDTSKIGERGYVFTGYDENGNKKEFAVLITVEDNIYPIISLVKNSIEITLGEDIDLDSLVFECYDEVEGELEYMIIEPSNYFIGSNEVEYVVKDKNNNTTSVILDVLVKEVINVPDTSNNSNNSANNGSSDTSSNTNNQNSSSSTISSKKFLFSDGYTMSNVYQVCSSELSKVSSGGCYPIYDNGLIIGMELIVNN